MSKQILCPNPDCRCVLSGKLTKAEIRTLLAQANAAKRKTFGTGNPTKPRLCPHCRGEFGARELKEHMPVCEMNPRNMAKEDPQSELSKVIDIMDELKGSLKAIEKPADAPLTRRERE